MPLRVQTSQGAQSVPEYPRGEKNHQQSGRAFSGSPIHWALEEGFGIALEIQSFKEEQSLPLAQAGMQQGITYCTVVMSGASHVLALCK